MVKFRLTIRGGILLGLWASAGIFLVALLLFVVFSAGWWVWPAAGVISAACFVGFPYSYRHRDITVGGTEIRVRAGLMFRHVVRLPRKHITGCSLFATPLQRAAKVCCVLVYTPGAFTIIIGMRREDAALFMDLLGGEAE